MKDNPQIILADYDKKYSSLKSINSQSKKYNPNEHKDRTRADIALHVVKWYFYLIGGVLFLGPIFNHVAKPEAFLDIANIITVLAGMISAPFGFVVGYYFKDSEKN
ncbi:hypothetical protein K2P47_03205 [Patescibacteria group bacterium]|nr:hypothetical protein [Patescibacteria group bacterium]